MVSFEMRSIFYYCPYTFLVARLLQPSQAVLPMKGVLLASCGVVKAAVGQEVPRFDLEILESKLGDTIYMFGGLRVSWPPPVMVWVV